MGKTQSMAELKATDKGKIVIVLREAQELAAENGYAGTQLAGKKVEKKAAKTKEGEPKLDARGKQIMVKAKPHNSKYASVASPDGHLWQLDENGDVYKDILAKAKTATGDLVPGKRKYSKVVQEFLIAIWNLTGTGGGGKGKTGTSVVDLW